MTAEETATPARETARVAASLAKAGDWDSVVELIASVLKAGREEVAATVAAWCDMVIEREPAPAPGDGGQQLAADWAGCWSDWAVSARRRARGGDEFFVALSAELVDVLTADLVLGFACLAALIAAAAGTEPAGAKQGAAS